MAYVESLEIKELSGNLKARYPNLLYYVDLEKIFFAFKTGDNIDYFKYEILGLKNDWVNFAQSSISPKYYCIAFSYDYFYKNKGGHIQWILLDLLYSCEESMDGKLRKRDVHEFSRILNTLDDLKISSDWRNNFYLPELLGEETIAFGFDSAKDY